MSKRRILMVDDDQDLRAAVYDVLSAAGYSVTLAEDGNEALSAISRDSPHLVIIDLLMPRRSGISALERLLTQAGSRPRVIVLTGNDDPRHLETVGRLGPDGLLHKPVDIGQLLARIRTLLDP